MPAHSVVREDTKCVGCVDCSKACPTKAIRARRGLMEVSPALCLDCGECIRVCQDDAVRARMSRPSDLKRLKYTVAVPSMTLYTQFGKDVCPSQVAAAIRHVGFDTHYESSPVSPIVSRAIDT